VSMYVILWRFRTVVGQESEFERAYGPSGEWALLFRRDDGYLGTELLRSSENLRDYLTLDRWISRAAYEAFRASWSGEYRRLDSDPNSRASLIPPFAPIHPTSYKGFSAK
jgi:heme-degrading monooxygenase HmoA